MKLGFAGDLSLAVLESEGADRRDEYARCTRKLTALADLSIANFESIIIPDDSICSCKMSVHESSCGDPSDFGFDIFSLANNHIRDCGSRGLVFSQRYLEEHGIHTVGVGSDRTMAASPLTMEHDGKLVAFLSATDATHYKATKRQPGVCPLSDRKLRRAIRAVSRQADLVVVSVHSDLEFSNHPAPWKVRLSRRLVEAGANIVVHHHPHTLQGIEMYQGGLIAYSLGNFLFPVNGNGYMRNRRGGVTKSIFLVVNAEWPDGGEAKLSYEAIPTCIGERNVVRIARGANARETLQRLGTYTDDLKRPLQLRRIYRKACRGQMRHFVYGVYYETRRGGGFQGLRYVRHHLMTGMHRNWMIGYLTLGWR